MNLKQLKYVLVLAEEGSFSRAAETLNISQPSLSQYIKKIELQLGVQLFRRTNGEVRVTDAGRVYIDAGKKMLDAEHQMETALSDLNSYQAGTVVVGISPYRSVHLMPAAFRAFNQLYPHMKLIIREKSGRDLIDGATRGEFDLCVIALPVDENVFNWEILHREEILVAVSKESALYDMLIQSGKVTPDRKFPSVDIRLLGGQDFAMLRDYMPMRIQTDRMLERFSVSVHEKIELSSNEALLSIVDSGVCASFVPSGIANNTDGKTAFFSIEQDKPMRSVAAVWRREQTLSKPVLDLIQILKAADS